MEKPGIVSMYIFLRNTIQPCVTHNVMEDVRPGTAEILTVMNPIERIYSRATSLVGLIILGNE